MWNMAAKGECNMKDNRGVTLVELLVAFVVGSLVLVALGYLLMTGLRLSGRNNAHVEVQSEAQTTMNLILDNVMEAGGICMINPAAGSNTQCALLGDLVVEESSGSYDVWFKGNAVVTRINDPDADGEPARKMYLVAFPNDAFPSDSGKTGYAKLISNVTKSEASEAERAGSAAKDALLVVDAYVRNTLSEDARTKWYLARYVTGCRMEVDRADTDYDKETVYYWNGSQEDNYYFKEPVTVKVVLNLEYDYGTGTVERTLEDSATIRNRLEKVYVDKNGTMFEYKRKK